VRSRWARLFVGQVSGAGQARARRAQLGAQGEPTFVGQSEERAFH
jgi:hypothetical protein